MSRLTLQRLIRGLYCAIAALAICGSAGAGIMLDSVPEANYVALSNQPQFASMGRFNESVSGTLIAPNWVLTAGHVGGVTSFQIRGSATVYDVAQIVQHPTFVLNNGNINLGYDLQLVRLTTDVVGVTPATIYRGTAEVGQEVTITGYGSGGTGSSGASLGLGQRAGTNVIDVVASFTNGAQNAIMVADFDSEAGNHNTLASFGSSPTPLPLEYHLGGFDSGGGVFLNVNGDWFLTGVNSGVESESSAFNNAPGFDTNLFRYGALSYITRVSSFQGFIDSTITAVPEPSTMALVGLFGVGFAIRKLRRRNREL